MSDFKIDSRKLRKVLTELIADVDKMEREQRIGGFIRGTGATIGKVGKYYIGIDVEEFDSDDLAIHTDAITEVKP